MGERTVSIQNSLKNIGSLNIKEHILIQFINVLKFLIRYYIILLYNIIIHIYADTGKITLNCTDMMCIFKMTFSLTSDLIF